MRRTLIIFDVDGTLTDSTVVDADCYIAALDDALGLRLDSADWSRFVDCTDAGIAAELFLTTHGRPIEEGQLAAFGARFFERLERTLASQPCGEISGAGALLARLRYEPEMAACIATGAWQRSARLKLDAASIDVSGLAFASCDDARNRRDIVRAAMRKAQSLHAGEGFEACVAVGDGVWDLETAAQLGIPFIGVASGAEARRLRAVGAQTVLESFSDAAAFMAAVTHLAQRAPSAGQG